jgi:hypothetical protein
VKSIIMSLLTNTVIDRVATNISHLIQVAILTKTEWRWRFAKNLIGLFYIYNVFFYNVWTINIWGIYISWQRCQKHSLYLARVLHIRCIRSAHFDISIPLGRVGRILWVWSITKPTTSPQIKWRTHRIFTHHENPTLW